MGNHPPLVSSAPREPAKLTIPPKVKQAVALMVRGPDNDGKPMSLCEAAKAVGLSVPALRRHFDRPSNLAYLRAEKRTYTALLIAANPAALADIRDNAENQMARVASVRELNSMDAAEVTQSRSQGVTPGVVINIVHSAPAPRPEPKAVEPLELEQPRQVDDEPDRR
jgi:hypothetical protein